MTRRLRIGALAAGATLLLLLALAPATLAAPSAAPKAAPTVGSLTAPVTGTTDNGGAFIGTLNSTRFVNQGGTWRRSEP